MIVFLCNFLALAGLTISLSAIGPAMNLGWAMARKPELIRHYVEVVLLMFSLGATLLRLSIELYVYWGLAK